MTRSSLNARRNDPYKNFKFRVKWDDRYVAGFAKVSALTRSTEAVQHREGDDPSTSCKTPARTKVDTITLERGITHDHEFEAWANAVQNLAAARAAAESLDDLRKNVVIELYDEAGRVASAWKVHRCWVSDYQALPDLDANGNAVAIETLKLETEGWERAETASASTRPNAPKSA